MDYTCRLLRLSLCLSAVTCLGAERSDLPIASFEGSDLSQWVGSGDAFGTAPHRPVQGFTGRHEAGVVWSGGTGDAATGKLESPEFKIQRRYLCFAVLGERNLPGTVGVELLAEGRVVRAASATEQLAFHFAEAAAALETMYARTWDVSDLEGKTVRLRVNDRSGNGAIAVDAFVQSDTPRSIPIDASQRMRETFRPQFHFTSVYGWLNDPNGLLYYRGTWHLFYQHISPADGFTVWGHATSTDLFSWEHRPVAIPPDSADGSYSGSGLVDWWNASGLKKGPHDPLLLFYSRRPPGAKMVTLPAPPDMRRMTQEMAYSTDGGATWQRYKDNPILNTPDYRDRDPKVIYLKQNRTWFMVLPLSANNADRPKATYGIFKSPDLKQWTLIQKLGPDGWFWECPDLYELPIDGDRQKTKWLLAKGSGDYLLGRFDEKGFHTEAGPIRTKFGGNYYATQTFQDAPDGRRVQIGWMNTGPKPEAVNVFSGMPFNQQMSVPREITLRSTAEGPRLFREPVKEIEALRVRTTKLPTGPLAADKNPLAGVSAELLDLEIDVTPGSARRIVLTVRGEEIAYDVAKQTLHAFASTAPLPLIDGRLQLRLLLDRTSIEIFGNRGVADISGVFFPDPANRALTLSAVGGPATLTRLIAHELRSAWPKGSTSD